MKKILLLSDTHDHLDPKLLPHLEAADEIWHAGDWGSLALADQLAAINPVRGVYGNIDGHELRVVYPEVLRFTCEEVSVLMVHIGGYPGRYSKLGRELLAAPPWPNIYITGHSHILKVMRDPKRGNLLHLNPGAAGIKGFHKVKTALRLKIDGPRIFDLEVIELGPRAERFTPQV